MVEKGAKRVINWRIVSVVLFVIFVQQLVCSLLYADSPFLIQTYFPGIDPKRIGHYAGYLVSLYNIGQIPGCLYWGWHADKYGRKRALVIITFVNGIIMIAFGLCHNFYAAITLRCIWGIMDGYLGICKTVLSEVCSQDMLPVTTGLIFVSMALASLLGPIIGGYLSDPEELLHGLIDRIPYLKLVPFSIPLACCGLMCFVCSLLILLFIDETLPLEERQKQQKMNEEMKRAMSGILRKRDRNDSLTTEEYVMLEMKENNYFSMFKDRMIVLSVFLYAVEGLIQTTYDTLLPVWLAAEKSVGGFSFDKKDLAWIVSFVCPMQMATLILFPVISNGYKTTTSVIVLSLIQVFVLAFTPIASTLNNLDLQGTVTVLFIMISSFHIIRSVIFNAQYVLIANSCYQEFRAKAYCLSQVLAGLLRFFGPTLIPMLFSWSIEKPRPFPLNYGLSMYTLALLTLLCVLMTIALPDSVNSVKGTLYEAVDTKMENRRLEKAKIANEDVKAPLLDEVV